MLTMFTDNIEHKLLVFFTLWSCVSASAQDSTSYCLQGDMPVFSAYEVFNSDIAGKKIILLGERHYQKANPILQTELWLHLNQHFGVKRMLIEFGHAEAYLYNRFLVTGDESYLQLTTPGILEHETFFQAWRRVYDHNITLGDDQKLSVHGLDLEREPGLSTTLLELLSQYPSSSEIDTLRRQLRARLDTIGVFRENQDYIMELRALLPRLALPPGEPKSMIEEIVNNNCFMNGNRDLEMKKKFVRMDTTEELYFGHFGANHVMMNQRKVFAGMLNTLERYENKMLSTIMYEGGSNRSSNWPFAVPDDCSKLLYRFQEADDWYNDMSQWAILLVNPEMYPYPKIR